jgi:hypothetical protein
MPTLPVDLCNRALSECGLEPIGDIEDGSPASRLMLRVYQPSLRQMLAKAPWNFARKQDILIVMADIYGQLISLRDVPAPWAYMYEWPVDCVDARWVLPTVPYEYQLPVPFLVTSAPRPNPLDSSWDSIEGHDPEQTRVIVTNHPDASLIYTALMQYPDAWDPLFEEAMVARLAAQAAMPLIADKVLARAVRGENLQIAKAALDTAMVRDGNEGWNVVSHTPDWITARTSCPGAFDQGVY